MCRRQERAKRRWTNWAFIMLSWLGASHAPLGLHCSLLFPHDVHGYPFAIHCPPLPSTSNQCPVHCHLGGESRRYRGGGREGGGGFVPSQLLAFFFELPFSALLSDIYFFSGGGEVQLSWRIATRGEICTRTRNRVRGKAGKNDAATTLQGCR